MFFSHDLELEEMLQEFMLGDMHHASMNLYNALNFPVEREPDGIYYNFEDMAQAYQIDASVANNTETKALESIKSISMLFQLHNESKELRSTEEYEDETFAAFSIYFVAVEFKEGSLNKFCKSIITNFMNKAFFAPVFILFKEENELYFSVQLRRKNRLDASKDTLGSPFISEPIDILAPDYNSIELLGNLNLLDLNKENFYMLYHELINAVAKDKFIITEFNDEIKADFHDDDLIGLYFNEIGVEKLLKPEEETALAKEVAKGNLKAKEKFIKCNLKLAANIALRYRGFGLDYLDLIQLGNIGLMEAVEKFDYRKGVKFSTHATWWIKQKILRGIGDLGSAIRLPIHVWEEVLKIRKFNRTFEERQGREASFDEISREFSVKIEKLNDILLTFVSLEETYKEKEDGFIDYSLVDSETILPEEYIENIVITEEIKNILDTLKNDKERKVIALRFGLQDGQNRTLEEVGKHFKLTRERIRQIESKALRRIQHPTRRKQIKSLTWNNKNLPITTEEFYKTLSFASWDREEIESFVEIYK